MATFRKLSAKVKKTKTSGSGTNQVFKPEWFAYEKMATFLHAIYTPRKTTTTDEVSYNTVNSSNCGSKIVQIREAF